MTVQSAGFFYDVVSTQTVIPTPPTAGQVISGASAFEVLAAAGNPDRPYLLLDDDTTKRFFDADFQVGECFEGPFNKIQLFGSCSLRIWPGAGRPLKAREALDVTFDGDTGFEGLGNRGRSNFMVGSTYQLSDTTLGVSRIARMTNDGGVLGGGVDASFIARMNLVDSLGRNVSTTQAKELVNVTTPAVTAFSVDLDLTYYSSLFISIINNDTVARQFSVQFLDDAGVPTPGNLAPGTTLIPAGSPYGQSMGGSTSTLPRRVRVSITAGAGTGTIKLAIHGR